MPRSQDQPGPACGARAQSLGSCPSSARSRPDEEPGRSVPRFPRRRGWGGAGVQCGRPRAAGRPRKQRLAAPPGLGGGRNATTATPRPPEPSWRWRQGRAAEPGNFGNGPANTRPRPEGSAPRSAQSRGRLYPSRGDAAREGSGCSDTGCNPVRAGCSPGTEVGVSRNPRLRCPRGTKWAGWRRQVWPIQVRHTSGTWGPPKNVLSLHGKKEAGPGEWGSGSGRGQASVAVFIRSVVGVFSGPSLGFQVISLLFAQEMLFPP